MIVTSPLFSFFCCSRALLRSFPSCCRSSESTKPGIFSSINEVLTLLVTVYIILGIYDLAEKLENKNLMLHGKVVLFLSASVFAAAVLFRTVPVFVPRTESLFNLIVAVMEFIGYLVFLIYLGRARKMLSGKE